MSLRFSKFTYKSFKLFLLLWMFYMISTQKISSYNKKSFDNSVLNQILRQDHSHADISEPITQLSLVIAHPDDELMFFAPTLLQLNRFLPTSIPFNIICFSDGDAEGLGYLRRKELHDSINLLLSSSNNRKINISILDFIDGMDQVWDGKQLLSSLQNELLVNVPPSIKNNILLTFDANGISNHPNHIACNKAVHDLISYDGGKDKEMNIIGLMLSSKSDEYNIVMNLLSKYTFFVIDLVKVYWNLATGTFNTIPNSASLELSFINTYSQYILSYASMLNTHKSQMVWFRYGWWWFSRFVFSNDLLVVSNINNV
ncbi:N-acetylglucosaminylphosphatidylinositol deacetylase NDAI_0K00330 [Naumovozyma dairenensis CBS 421]|uniref:N-acetylglucosaminylphosphatidylinositol deacetylase n=1 Tax=Naumovozyma dairenensis (strain ATCC 10597 / BCRC 20456 / CBS 421 / NBRC 0211 / NRRL Y-12639) TaxID=1071378 RepID=G0WHG1_NAUDC|nr:hypothetical protein NDAI_0K00330 [Naumovozyma dairenensis CBS 421]CCD27222.1 hypothetical protein NDAI_0K00330 [Naumovozyma dairenensis CBS 421]